MKRFEEENLCSTQGMTDEQLLFLTEKELKKEELITALVGLIKNYAIKQQQNQ